VDRAVERVAMSAGAASDEPRARRRRGDRWEEIVLGAVGVCAVVIGWELAARSGLVNPVIASSPGAIAAAFARQWQSGDWWADVSVSLAEFAVGFALSLVVGVALGVAMGMSRVFEYAVDPFIWFLYASPLIAFYPLIIVWLGFGSTTVVALTFLLTFVSIAVNTMAGVRSVEPQLVRAVRAFGGSPLDVAAKVVLPASVPLMLAGVRIGLGRALIGVILGEMFSSNGGLGYHISYYGARLKTADLFVPLMTVVVIGVVTTRFCAVFERWFLSWRD
jgi:ABC-type nitrate/sulfonate/bicarbonate transport system permease component